MGSEVGGCEQTDSIYIEADDGHETDDDFYDAKTE